MKYRESRDTWTVVLTMLSLTLSQLVPTFKKFKDGTLAYDDSFGYVDQIKAYAHSQGKKDFGWLAMDKANGHLAVLKYDLEDTQAPVHETIKGDIEERIVHVKEMVKGDEPEAYCADPVPDGKSGNMKLAVKCSYCPYKKHCYPDLRGFLYTVVRSSLATLK